MNRPTRKTPTLEMKRSVHTTTDGAPEAARGSFSEDVHEADAEHQDDTRVLRGKVPIALHELRELTGDDLAVDGGHCVGRRLRGAGIEGEIWSCE